MTAPKLLGGPYLAPNVTPGDWLNDLIHGAVEVGGWHDGRIPWPRRKKTGTHSLILCDALAEAVRTESAKAIAYWFGAGSVTVAKWRRALGVDRQNCAGTQMYYKEQYPEKLPPEAAALGREHARLPDALARMAASHKGKTMPAEVRQKIKNTLTQRAKNRKKYKNATM
jgi:hypothetical protein